MLYRNNRPQIMMNDVTHGLLELLINDSIKVGKLQGYPTPFTIREFKRLSKATRLVNYNEKFRINGTTCSLLDAGHIPGSGGILIEEKKRTFFTGDIQTDDSHLLNPCVLPKKVDTLILESTYGDRVRRDRADEEQQFLECVEEGLANNESVLIPTFAVGRAAEIISILENYAGKIALDGMAKKATEIAAQYSRYLKGGKKLRHLLRKVHLIKTRKQRKSVVKKYPIIISSAGMLSGGPAVSYLRDIRKREHSKVIFTGFLAEDSPGRKLMQTSRYISEEDQFNVKCNLNQFELSAHADRNGLVDIIRRTKPKKVICVHGDNTKKFAKFLEKEFPNIEFIAPKNGDIEKL